jgi:alkanesulfonate monooxygenase SsuD/methylene tetrahydromethanopterin reductase-like flavin-dependent oxidoreductase (luciferase family)
MDIGIGLPNAVPGVDRGGIVEWARRAEAAGFSSLGTLDRIAYGNYESLIALAAAAAVTDRIRLATDILIAPLRPNTSLLAKQALTIDHLAGGGRVVLGLAPGGREDDYTLGGVDFSRRGRIFERQLETLGGVLRGEGGVGPAPTGAGRPTVLVGGSVEAAYRRAARFGDGWTAGGGGPERFAEGRAKAVEAWRGEGRDGEPRTMALFYFALGDDPEGDARRSLGDYYSFAGSYADAIVAGAAKDADTIRGYLAAYREAGCDEVICFPASADPQQVDLLARAVL